MKAEHWYAVSTHPRKEDVVCEILSRKGFVTYVPKRSKLVIANRHTKRREAREFPIVPSLAFVGSSRRIADDPSIWHELTKPHPVTGIIGDGVSPRCIPWRQIEEMVKRNGDDERTLRLRANLPAFDPLDEVRITDGVFSGLMATVQQVTGERARLLLNLLGPVRSVEIDVDFLAAAE